MDILSFKHALRWVLCAESSVMRACDNLSKKNLCFHCSPFLSFCKLSHPYCLILVFGALAVSGLLPFWHSILPPPLISSGHTGNQPCRLVGGWRCSIPAPKAEWLCSDPPCGAAPHVMCSAVCLSSKMKNGSAVKTVTNYSHPCLSI